jgi:hypothetical protein
MKVGYIRISTKDQNTARQDVLMEQLGVEKVFTDKLSGKNTDRPELQKMMDFVREGDELVVESFSRFARNTRDLLNLTDRLKEKKVRFVSRKESIDTSTPAGEFKYYALVKVTKDKAGNKYHFITNRCGMETFDEAQLKAMLEVMDMGGVRKDEKGSLSVHKAVEVEGTTGGASKVTEGSKKNEGVV